MSKMAQHRFCFDFIISSFANNQKHTSRWFLRTSPTTGSNSPINNFKKVDLPTPLGPTMAIRLLISIPKSVLTNNDDCPGKLNVTSKIKDQINFWFIMI